MARSQMPDLKTIEPYDVSFAEIRSDEKWLETIQKVATAIDVQFTESSKQLPFVPSSETLIGIKGEYGVYHVDQKGKRSVINPFDRRAVNY